MSIVKKVAQASLIAASGLLATVAPAAPAASNDAAQARPASSRVGEARRVDPDRTICIQVAFTGTRVLRRVCKSARAWEAEGGIPPADD